MTRLHVLTALLAALTCSGLQAQTNLTAKIPFDFQLGSATMPAGEYRIDYSNRVLMVRSNVGNHVAIALTLPRSRSNAPETPVLEFRSYGDSHFFAEIWTPNSTSGGALPKSAREMDVARRAAPQPTVIALGGR